jgi:hypothetical protein
MSAAAPANFNAEEADNLEDVRNFENPADNIRIANRAID